MIDKNEKILNIKGFNEYIIIKTFKNNEYHCKIFTINLFNKNTIKINDSISFDISINFTLTNELLIGEINDEDLIIGYYKNETFKSNIIKRFYDKQRII